MTEWVVIENGTSIGDPADAQVVTFPEDGENYVGLWLSGEEDEFMDAGSEPVSVASLLAVKAAAYAYMRGQANHNPRGLLREPLIRALEAAGEDVGNLYPED